MEIYKMSKVQNNPPQFIKNGTKFSEITIILKNILIFFSYLGQWDTNQKHGAGIYTGADGQVYEGEYVRDKRHGHGCLTNSDGLKKNQIFLFRPNLMPRPSNVNSASSKTPKSTFLLQNSKFASTKILILY